MLISLVSSIVTFLRTNWDDCAYELADMLVLFDSFWSSVCVCLCKGSHVDNIYLRLCNVVSAYTCKSFVVIVCMGCVVTMLSVVMGGC